MAMDVLRCQLSCRPREGGTTDRRQRGGFDVYAELTLLGPWHVDKKCVRCGRSDLTNRIVGARSSTTSILLYTCQIAPYICVSVTPHMKYLNSSGCFVWPLVVTKYRHFSPLKSEI